MSNEEKASLVPKLRFPEFRKAGEWRFVELNELAVRCKQRNRNESIDRVLTNSAEFGVLDQRDYFEKDIATQGKLDSYFVVEPGDYVYNPRISTAAPVGPISRNDTGTGVMSPLYTVFRFTDPKNDFYQHYFKTTAWHGYLRQAASTGARHDRMAIGNDAFMAMLLPAPSPREQRRIADCLTSLDELIAAQARKVNALSTHKKGLMQGLFPRDGEARARLRLPGFRAAEAWEKVSLGDLVVVASGQVDPEESPYCDMPHIGSDNIEAHTGNLRDVRTARDLGLISGKYLFSENDVLYSKIRPALNKVAAPDFGGICSADIYPLRPSSKKLIRGYLAAILSSDVFLEYAAKHSERSKIPKLNRETLLTYRLAIPSHGEQQRICDGLAAVNDHVTAAVEELGALKTHKKGLMQQLFPSAEALDA